MSTPINKTTRHRKNFTQFISSSPDELRLPKITPRLTTYLYKNLKLENKNESNPDI